jgi:putative spermidine/putrescine transport system permease protein
MVELDLVGTAVGIALIHSVIIIPITIIIIISNLVGFDQRLEQAALSLGASRLRTFFTVTFPIIRTGILIAALFAFIYSFDEVVIALFLSEIKGTTLPVVIWETIREELNPTISAVCSILVVITAILLFLVGLAKKREEQ